MPSEKNDRPMSPSAQAAWNAGLAALLPQALKVAEAHVSGQAIGYVKGYQDGIEAQRVAIQNRAILAPEAS